jgi:hypothetical protein
MPFSIVERIKFRALMTQKWWPDNAVISGRLSTAGRPGRRGKSLQVPPLSRQPGIAGGRQPHAGHAVIQPCELIVTDEIMPAAALGLAGLTMNGPALLAVEVAADLSFVLASAIGFFSNRR